MHVTIVVKSRQRRAVDLPRPSPITSRMGVPGKKQSGLFAFFFKKAKKNPSPRAHQKTRSNPLSPPPPPPPNLIQQLPLEDVDIDARQYDEKGDAGGFGAAAGKVGAVQVEVCFDP